MNHEEIDMSKATSGDQLSQNGAADSISVGSGPGGVWSVAKRHVSRRS